MTLTYLVRRRGLAASASEAARRTALTDLASADEIDADVRGPGLRPGGVLAGGDYGRNLDGLNCSEVAVFSALADSACVTALGAGEPVRSIPRPTSHLIQRFQTKSATR